MPPVPAPGLIVRTPHTKRPGLEPKEPRPSKGKADGKGDGKSKGISRCSSARCGFKYKYFVPRDRVFSTVTHRTYDVIIAPGEKNVNCHSSNCIYLMTCNNCNLQTLLCV